MKNRKPDSSDVKENQVCADVPADAQTGHRPEGPIGGRAASLTVATGDDAQEETGSRGADTDRELAEERDREQSGIKD